jgi:hypothetical protein
MTGERETRQEQADGHRRSWGICTSAIDDLDVVDGDEDVAEKVR